MANNNTLVAPNTPKKRSNKPKELICPHCRKIAYLRKFKDTENFYLWSLNRRQEHELTDRMLEDDYSYFIRNGVYLRRVNWISNALRQMGNRRYDNER